MSLTSFETILLDCIVTTVISICIFKKTLKLVNFCTGILILKMEENEQHFRLLCFVISRKVKNTTETHTLHKSSVQEICAVYGL